MRLHRNRAAHVLQTCGAGWRVLRGLLRLLGLNRLLNFCRLLRLIRLGGLVRFRYGALIIALRVVLAVILRQQRRNRHQCKKCNNAKDAVKSFH